MKIFSLLIAAVFMFVTNLTVLSYDYHFIETFNDYIGSSVEQVEPANWEIYNFESKTSTVTGAFTSNRSDRSIKLFSSVNKQIQIRKKFHEPFRDKALVIEIKAMVDNQALRRDVPAVLNSDADGQNYTRIATFDSDGKIKLMNSTVIADTNYEINTWYDIKAYIENIGFGQYITIYINGELKAARQEVNSPILSVDALRITQSGATGKSGSLYLDDLKLSYPSKEEQADMITQIEALSDFSEPEFIYPAESDIFSIDVNGEKVHTEKFLNISYSGFSFENSSDITVNCSMPIESFDISPHSFNIEGNASENELKFSLTEPKKLIITINDTEKLFIFADEPEKNIPNLSDSNVINILDKGIFSDDGITDTKKVQAAIDEISKSGGGVLYFPPGKYITGVLKIRSNVTVYLAEGAILKASSNPLDFPNQITLDDGNRLYTSGYIMFDNAQNAKITGRGVIDGNGTYLREGFDVKHRDIFIVKSNNIEVSDVILRNPATWNSHFLLSDNITYDNVKIINNIDMTTSDGIDPDSSRDVLINNVFSYASDDSIAIKTSNSYFREDLPRTSYNLIIKDGIFWTKKSSLKVGTETLEDISNVLFINNDVVHADRAIAIYEKDGANISDIRYINNRAEKLGGDTNPGVIVLDIAKRNPDSIPGYINNVLIKDFAAEEFTEDSSTIIGLSEENRIDGVVFDNVVIGGRKINSIEEGDINVNLYIKNIQFLDSDKDYEGIKLRINGNSENYDVPPIIADDEILLPMRACFEGLGAKVSWDSQSGIISAVYEDKKLELRAGEAEYIFNGEIIKTQAASQLVNNRMMIPSATLKTVMDAYVSWESKENTVYILSSEQKPLDIDKKGAYIEKSGLVVFEAEGFSKNTPSDNKEWILDNAVNGFSGKGSMLAVPDTGANISENYLERCPVLTYKISFSTPGRYYIWSRCFGDSSADSLHAALNGRAVKSGYQILSDNSSVKYGWTAVTNGKFTPYVDIKAAGIYNFDIYMKEDGIRLDKFILTTDISFSPVEAGPAESEIIN